MKTVRVRLTFTEELLGTASANPDIYSEFIASKGPSPDEEVAALPDVEEEIEKSTTVFPRMADDTPFVYDYQIKGLFKDACGMLRRADDMQSKKLTAYKKVIDGLVFVTPRQIPLVLSGPLGICERPLRAQTAQGERIALARSESAPAGTTVEFEVTLLRADLEDQLDEWLDYGKFRGLGQWRNSGKGAFDYVELTSE